ncbi:hypothetical protein GGR21_001254 [Dysgonomonas hofstadii]|uniref:Lipoprotein n=1 Tax=Dysgonomonas hofstadii TaxID=637886 RepID=A0A840CR08_9BACT|nr:hypothetical protein [Dysgonomonas hofstadii]MBB4035365.1 hypothetical protein [Dysgonomonas hofstadii]
MNNIFKYAIAILLLSLYACDPIENRDEMKGNNMTEAKISATPVVVDGMNSNKVILNSEGNKCLSNWNWGTGSSSNSYVEAKLVVKGDQNITYTGLNPDGTQFQQVLTVHIETLLDVSPLWGYLCGTGTKEWTWTGTAWGIGEWQNATSPNWWGAGSDMMNDHECGLYPYQGTGATMTFTVAGGKLTIKRSDGKTMEGFFSIDDTKTLNRPNGNPWSVGQLKTTGVTVLHGGLINDGCAPVYQYEIVVLDDDKLVLAAQNSAGAGTYWMFAPI